MRSDHRHSLGHRLQVPHGFERPGSQLREGTQSRRVNAHAALTRPIRNLHADPLQRALEQNHGVNGVFIRIQSALPVARRLQHGVGRLAQASEHGIGLPKRTRQLVMGQDEPAHTHTGADSASVKRIRDELAVAAVPTGTGHDSPGFRRGRPGQRDYDIAITGSRPAAPGSSRHHQAIIGAHLFAFQGYHGLRRPCFDKALHLLKSLAEFAGFLRCAIHRDIVN